MQSNAPRQIETKFPRIKQVSKQAVGVVRSTHSRDAHTRQGMMPWTPLVKQRRMGERSATHHLNTQNQWWRWTESNRRPPACKAGALPIELHPQLAETTRKEAANPKHPVRPDDEAALGPRRLNQAAPLHLWWAREDLNLRPHAYQACALTN